MTFVQGYESQLLKRLHSHLLITTASNTLQLSSMNAGFNIAHKAVVGTLVFASLWGTYSVAGGTGIVLKRRWDRSQAAKKDEKKDDNFYIPVEPSSNEPKVKRVN